MPTSKRPPAVADEPQDAAGTPPAPADETAGQVAAQQQGATPTEVLSTDQAWAYCLRESVPSIFLFATMNEAFPNIREISYIQYGNKLVQDCGSPTDPIEVMAIEQLALAHFALGRLQCRAANAKQPQAIGVYATAAARMMAEFRRSSLALQAYRAASRQLAATSPKSDLILDGEHIGLEHEPEEKACAGEEELPTGDSHDERRVVPIPRAANA